MIFVKAPEFWGDRMESVRVVSGMELSDLWMVIMRRWKLVFVTIIICGILGAVAGTMAPVRYSATASLTVAPLTTSPFAASAPQQVNIVTEREVMGSREVAEGAVEMLNDIDIEELMANTSVAAPTGSQVLKVTVRDTSPDKAAAQANALSEAYLSFRSEGADRIAAGQIDLLNQQVAELTSRDTLTPAEREELSSLHEQLTALGLVGQVPGRVISPASPSKDAVSAAVAVYVVAGVMAGVLLGCGIVLGREGIRRRKEGPALHSARQRIMPQREGPAAGRLIHDHPDVQNHMSPSADAHSGTAEDSLRT